MMLHVASTILGILLLSPHAVKASSAELRGTKSTGGDPTLEDLFELNVDSAATVSMDPTACVTLEVYGKDQSCSGEPVETEHLNTYEKPGAPCEHDHTMPSFISAKDRYCDFSDGTFHQTVYVGSSKCSKSFIHHLIPPHKQVFHENDCLNGLKLISCKAGPCDSNYED